MKQILLSHGAGGKEMTTLIEQVFLSRYGSQDFTGDDSATLSSAPTGWPSPPIPSWWTRSFFPAATSAAWRWRAR